MKIEDIWFHELKDIHKSANYQGTEFDKVMEDYVSMSKCVEMIRETNIDKDSERFKAFCNKLEEVFGKE